MSRKRQWDEDAEAAHRDMTLTAHRNMYAHITDKVAATFLRARMPGPYRVTFALTFVWMVAFVYAAVWLLFVQGVGIMGVNIPSAWGFPIANFVWWIGIGHAGTLISAVLLLLHQQWRTSINRFAEAMTIFAAGIAGLWPIFHLGRPEYFYWLLPYPNVMELWPQWRSALVWDFFAIFTYIVVSILFWYTGLIPDLATVRDRCRNTRARLWYGLLALGWRGSARHWATYHRAYVLMAAMATPLVVFVHSVVSLDFAETLLPGYHSTIFPPYFVAGAIFSGFCMVVTISVPLRKVFGLQEFITERHFNNMGKLMLAAGLLVDYGYVMEFFIAWYSGSPHHIEALKSRITGDYAPVFWTMMVLNVGALQLLWWRQVRTHALGLFALANVLNIAMWLERFFIVIPSSLHGFLPSSYHPVQFTVWDYLLLAGSLGLFFTLLLLFIKTLPALSMHELNELWQQRQKQKEKQEQTHEPG